MKLIMGVLVVLIMAFTLVSIGEAGTCSLFKDNPGASSGTHKVPADAGVKDADRPGQFSTGTPGPCIESPAYPIYSNAREITCSTNDKDRRVQEPMGSCGF
jgi:hypothetical protein